MGFTFFPEFSIPGILKVKPLVQVAYHLVMLTAFLWSSDLIFSGILLYHHTFCQLSVFFFKFHLKK